MYFTKDMWNLLSLLRVGTLIELEFIILLYSLETYPTVRSIQIYFSLIFIGRCSSSYKPCYVQSQSITTFSDLQHYRLFQRCHGEVTSRLYHNHEKVHPVWYLHIHTLTQLLSKNVWFNFEDIIKMNCILMSIQEFANFNIQLQWFQKVFPWYEFTHRNSCLKLT